MTSIYDSKYHFIDPNETLKLSTNQIVKSKGSILAATDEANQHCWDACGACKREVSLSEEPQSLKATGTYFIGWCLMHNPRHSNLTAPPFLTPLWGWGCVFRVSFDVILFAKSATVFDSKALLNSMHTMSQDRLILETVVKDGAFCAIQYKSVTMCLLLVEWMLRLQNLTKHKLLSYSNIAYFEIHSAFWGLLRHCCFFLYNFLAQQSGLISCIAEMLPLSSVWALTLHQIIISTERLDEFKNICAAPCGTNQRSNQPWSPSQDE